MESLPIYEHKMCAKTRLEIINTNQNTNKKGEEDLSRCATNLLQ